MINDKNKRFLSYLLTGLFVMGCTSEEQEKIAIQATKFIESYLNLNFDKTYQACTPESRKWISFHASNLTEEDLQVVRSSKEDARVISTQCDIINDSIAKVDCTIEGVCPSGSIDNNQSSFSKAEYSVYLVKRKKKWLVKMEAPLQNAE